MTVHLSCIPVCCLDFRLSIGLKKKSAKIAKNKQTNQKMSTRKGSAYIYQWLLKNPCNFSRALQHNLKSIIINITTKKV